MTHVVEKNIFAMNKILVFNDPTRKLKNIAYSCIPDQNANLN